MKNALRKLCVWVVLCCFETVVILCPGLAVAQTATPQGAYSGLAAINKIILNTPGISSITSAGSTSVSGAAVETAQLANGVRIPVSTTATALASASRLATFAGRAMKVGSVVGLATVVVPLVFDALGLQACPPPDFFCKRSPSDKYTPSVVGGWGDAQNGLAYTYQTGQLACEARVAKINYGSYGSVSFVMNPGSTSAGQCMFQNNAANGGGAPRAIAYPTSSGVPEACQPGFVLSGSTCIKTTPTLVPVAAEEIATALTPVITANPAAQQRVYEETIKTGAKIFYGTDPVTVSAPPVVVAPQVETSTITNPDGSTSTKVVTTTTTVTPKVTGTTINDTNITYPTSTVTKTEITNNTTNVTNVTNQTKVETAPPIPVPIPLPAEPTPDFCATNRGLTICQNSTVSGSCSSVTCSGDAIQCATLQAASRIDCREVDDIKAVGDMTTTSDGRSILSGSDPKAVEIAKVMSGTEVDMSQQKLDASGFLGGGACFPTRTITLAGKPVTFDFSAACQKIEPLRYVFIAVGTLVGYLIVSRSVLQG